MKCMYCHGAMKRGFTSYHVDDDDLHIILDKVPAWVCEQCGEVYFEEDDVNSIQEFVAAVRKQANKLHQIA